MDSSCFTMPYLESLSTSELVTLAETYGLDIPQGLERVFIIEELLYLEHNGDDKTGGLEDLTLRDFKELTVLPAHYNISFIEVLVRDPLWAFVFWEVKEHDREQFKKDEDFSGYFLRVVPLKEGEPNLAASFTIAVNVDDGAWYLGFPPDDGRSFKVELCALCGESYTTLAESRPFVLPPLVRPNEYLQAVYRNPLAQLSGVDHFSLIRSEDRLPRIRGIS